MENSGKTVAIVSYLTVIGWIIAFVIHQNNKSNLGKFHLRQTFGIMLMFLANSFLVVRISPWLSGLVALGILVLWVIGLIAAINEEEKPLPFLGKEFQKWFAFID